MFDEEQEEKYRVSIDKSYVKGAIIGGLVGIPLVATMVFLVIRNQPIIPPQNTNQVVSKESTSTNKSKEELKIKGNKKSRIYHLPYCKNYNDISDKNVIWFSTVDEAKAMGFRMAKNC